MPNEFYSGTVATYNDRAGFGFVTPDDAEACGASQLLVHCRSLRHGMTNLQVGERVIFQIQSIPRGLLAADVHLEQPETSGGDDQVEEAGSGFLAMLYPDRGFGFIEDNRAGKLWFHFSQLPNPNLCPAIGTQVYYEIWRTDKGLQARNIFTQTIYQTTTSMTQPASPASQDLLAQAILARDDRRFEEAEKLYERGLKESPSVQLVTSYAAMEKNLNRRSEAMVVFEKGLNLFPNNTKLCEDAGNLAATLKDWDKALEFLDRGLQLCLTGHQGNERVFYLAIARTYAKRGRHSDLEKSLEYFTQAQRAFTSISIGRASFPKSDLLEMNLVSIRLQHQRGQLAFEFLRRAGFNILKADMLPQTTVGADLSVESRIPGLAETYGISGSLLLRCMFKSRVDRDDIENLDVTARDLGQLGLIDDQVILLLVASLPESLETVLSTRIEDRNRSKPAIVPLTQSQLETAEDPIVCLRSILDRWLYRRDLFAQNGPVTGQRFFGRDKPLADLQEAITTGAAAGIFGLRKVGKTSLLKEIDLRSSETGDLTIYQDLLRIPADVTDCRWIYWKLGLELHKRINRLGVKNIRWRLGGTYSDYMDIPPEFPIASAFDSDLSRVLKAIGESNISPRPKIVVMLDEIERILPTTVDKRGMRGFFEFFSYIRGVSQENSDFVPIVTGANAAVSEVAQFDARDNPVFNFFKEIYLPLLRGNESSHMILTLGRGMGVKFSSEACDRIYQLTGGHPFFTRQFCSFVCDQHPERPYTVKADQVEDLIYPYLANADRDFREIIERFSRDYPEELEVCKFVADSDTRIPLQDFYSRFSRSLNLKHLLGYQIISIEKDTVGLTMELLREWLRRRA